MSPKSVEDKKLKPREHRNREEDVILAAIEVFAEKGYAGASIQDVADKVGVLKGSLYYYIDSKQDLLFHIFDASHKQAVEIVAEVNAMDAPPLEKLHAYVEKYVLWYLQNVERVSIYFSEWRHLTGAHLKTVKKQRQMYEKIVFDLIDDARSAGSISKDIDPKYATFFALGAINGVPTWYRRKGPDRPETIARGYADLTIGSLVGTVPRES